VTTEGVLRSWLCACERAGDAVCPAFVSHRGRGARRNVWTMNCIIIALRYSYFLNMEQLNYSCSIHSRDAQSFYLNRIYLNVGRLKLTTVCGIIEINDFWRVEIRGNIMGKLFRIANRTYCAILLCNTAEKIYTGVWDLPVPTLIKFSWIKYKGENRTGLVTYHFPYEVINKLLLITINYL